MFEAIISKIEQYDSIVIFGHLNPDGDCYGSQIALRNILRTRYPEKQIYCVGSGLKKFFDIIGKMDVVSDEIIVQSLAIVLDSNDINRLEDQRGAWTFKNNMSAPECAGVIHTDFQKGFICAEVYPYDAIKELGSEHAVKEAGKIRTEGKGYYPKDGDIMFFRFNVKK